jgi:predicted nucleic acid-binding protein
MRWLLDTNVVIDAFAGRADTVRAITSARTAALEWIGLFSGHTARSARISWIDCR